MLQSATARFCVSRCTAGRSDPSHTVSVLVMMGGLPAAGKSHLAEAIADRTHAVIVSVDSIEDVMIRSRSTRTFETGLAASNVGATIAAKQLQTGSTVIAHAANYLDAGRDLRRRS